MLLSAIWGSSFLFIKVLDRHWPPLWVAFGRISLGALTLCLVTRARGERLAFERGVWVHLLIAGALLNAIPFTLFAVGETRVSSIVAGLWNATTPLWVLIAVLAVFGEERPSAHRIAGLLIGFVGVVIVLGPWRGLGHGRAAGDLACAAAAVSYGLGFPYIRRHLAGRELSVTALSAGQLLCATAMLAILVPLARAPTATIGLAGIASILGLGVFGTGIAYVLNYAIIRAAGSAVASTVTYLIPVFSTLLGVVVLGERLSWNEPAGALVLLVGITICAGPDSAISGARDAWRGRPRRELPLACAADGSGAPPRSRRRGRSRRGTRG